MLSVHAITLFVYLLLQSGETTETRKWLTLSKEPSLTYDKEDLQFEPELIATETIEIAPTINAMVEAMEADMEKFTIKFQKHINETNYRACRSVKEELKMPPEARIRTSVWNAV